MLRQVHFHGPLKDTLGVEHIELDVDTPTLLIRALMSQVQGFRQVMIDQPEMMVLLANGKHVEPLTEQSLELPFGQTTDIHMAPAVAGAGFDPLTISIWIAETFTVSYATAIAITSIAIKVGTLLVLGAILRTLAPSPQTREGGASPEQRPSFLFNGATNVIDQGYAIPLVYGIHTVGSTVISAGVDTVELPYETKKADDAPADLPEAIWQWTGEFTHEGI